MKAGWEVKTLGDVCKIARGGSPRPIKTFVTDDPEGINWIRISDTQKGGRFIDHTEQKIRQEGVSRSRFVTSGSFLLSNSMSFGRPYILRIDGCIHDGWLVLEPDYSTTDQDFLYHVLGSSFVFKQFDKLAAGSTVRNLNKDLVSKVSIPLPPLAEQKRIVSILDEAFEGLDRARENAEANLKSARELFGASSKKLLLNENAQSSVGALKDNIIDLANEIERKKKDKKFRGPLVLGADTLPETPKDWLWSSPEQLSTNIVDCLHTTPKWSNGGKICLRTTNFQPNFLNLTSARYVSDETYSKRIARLEPKPGDVLYSREGGILGIACEFPSGLEACLGQRMMMFRLRREWILPTYFCWVMNSDFILKEVTRLTGGAAAPHLNIGDIRRFPIPVPPMAIQHQIVEELGQFQRRHNQLLEKLSTKLQDISDLRQSLLQKAFAGELT